MHGCTEYYLLTSILPDRYSGDSDTQMDRLQEMMVEFCDQLNLKDPDEKFYEELTPLLGQLSFDDIKSTLQKKNFFGCKPLNWAAKQGHSHVITAFLTAVPMERRLRLLQTNKYTPLHQACRQVNVIKTILSHLSTEQKATLICSQSRDSCTPLHETVNWGKTDIAKILLDSLTPKQQLQLLAVKDKDGKTAVQIADSKDDMDMEELLIDYQEQAQQSIDKARLSLAVSDEIKERKEDNSKRNISDNLANTFKNLELPNFAGNFGKMIPFSGKQLSEDIKAKVNRCRIPSERLSIGQQLGKGNFGVVYKGKFIAPSGNIKTVAVKSIRDDREMSFEDLENFLTEGTLMIDFKHENVLSLIGVVYEKADLPLVVIPFMENGDLCTFVKKEDLTLTLADILHFGYQIANGMKYLAEKKFVHRDLAARNCMIDGFYMVKIADFGMSRDIYKTDYYTVGDMSKPVPMKWMALESLKEGRYTSSSDVWSFGVTLWELFTRGSTPYPGVTNYGVKKYVDNGQRLDKPASCPPMIYEMMLRCWAENPHSRPSFDEISQFIGKILSNQPEPEAGATGQDGYLYVRYVTKDIPEDYLINNLHHDYDNIITAQTVWEVYIDPAAQATKQ